MLSVSQRYKPIWDCSLWLNTYCISRICQISANLFSYCVGMDGNHQFWLVVVVIAGVQLKLVYIVFFSMYMFQPHHALILAYLVFWALHLEGSWLEYYLLERCGLSKLKQVNVWKYNVSGWINLNLYSSQFEMVTFCLIQGTQLDWTLVQLQQTFLVRNFLFFLPLIFFSLGSYWLLSSFFRMSLLRSKTTTCFYQPFPLWE